MNEEKEGKHTGWMEETNEGKRGGLRCEIDKKKDKNECKMKNISSFYLHINIKVVPLHGKNKTTSNRL